MPNKKQPRNLDKFKTTPEQHRASLAQHGSLKPKSPKPKKKK